MKLNKVAALFTTAALAVPLFAWAQPANIQNWRSADGNVWRNGTQEHCWRSGFWTPATAFGDRLVTRLEARAGLAFKVDEGG